MKIIGTEVKIQVNLPRELTDEEVATLYRSSNRKIELEDVQPDCADEGGSLYFAHYFWFPDGYLPQTAEYAMKYLMALND